MRPNVVIITVSVAFVLALSLFLIPQESSASSQGVSRSIPDIAGSPQNFYVVSFLSNGETYEAGLVFLLQGLVEGEDVNGTYVSVTMEDPHGTQYLNLTTANETGIWWAEFETADDVGGNFTVLASADALDSKKVNDSIKIFIVVPPPEEEEEEIPFVYFQLGALFAAFASMAVASTESAGFSLFNIFAFPLYSRIKKDEVLDHFVRGQIYQYIVSNPGKHYNSIREKLQVTNGTLSYHLRTLEVQGFIKSRKESIYRRFYPIEMKFPRDKGVKLSDMQITILAALRRRPAPTQKDIAEDLGISQQVASYNLRILARKGLVQVRKDGRKRMYYPDDSGSPTRL
ncbi:MAG: helix-turn-helix domain-containing protein [Thermoplasmata archaeon]|nr:helix-turn-helix domain-containing protein [Thermoplasmata archaeon]